MAIRRNLHFRLISVEWAKTIGRKAIENEFETLLRVSQNRVQYTLRRRVELPPEERGRLERWRDGYVADWERIVDDVGRAGSE